MSTALKLIRNTAYHAGGRIWQIAVSIFLAPLILSYLGDQQFGLWVLFWTFSVYFMFMDFGLGVSLVRETVFCHSQCVWLPINKAVNSLFLLYIILGATVSFVSYYLSPWLAVNLDISADMKRFVSEILIWSGGIFALIGIVNTCSALLRGLQRYDQITKAMVYVSFPNVIGSYVVLAMGYGIPGLLWVVAGVYTLQVCILLFYVKQLIPELAFGAHFLSFQQIKGMLPFGMRIQVSKLAELASYQSDKVLLAFLLPIQFVTMYDLGARVASLMRDLPYSLTSAVFPAASEMHEKADFEKLWKMYDRGSKYMLLITFPMLIGIYLTAHLVIGMWLGNVAVEVYQSVLILSFAYWVVISVAMIFSVGTGMGWSTPIMQSALLQALLNIVLSYALIKEIGFMGALYGTTISIVIANSILYIRFCRCFHQSIRVELKRFWLVFKANILPMVLCGVFVMYGNVWLEWGNRMQSLLFFMIIVLTYALSYIFSLKMMRVFDQEDLRLLGGKLPFLEKLIGVPKKRGQGI